MAIRSPTRVSIANESAYGSSQVRKALPCKFVSLTAHSSDPSFDWKMYRYVPSLPAAILFLVLFSILTLAHVYTYLRYRKTSTIYVILGGICKTSPTHTPAHLTPLR